MAGQAKAPFYVAVAFVILGLVAFAAYRMMSKAPAPDAAQQEKQEREDLPAAPPFAADRPAKVEGENGKSTAETGEPAGPVPEEIAGKIIGPGEIPDIGVAGEYQMKNNIIDVELSAWPGYAPLIVANGGLAPNPKSYFATTHGFQLKINMDESESAGWERINSGQVGVSSTTVDVLALYANQLKVEAPVQLDFLRGGDSIITLKELTSINQLKGKTLTAARFTESDFFIRFLANEAGLQIHPLADLEAAPVADRINLLYTETAEDAAEIFINFLERNDRRIVGTVTWAPFTVDIPRDYKQTRLLTTNRNLLVIADVLIVNNAFAKKNPKIVQGLVDGILQGVEMIRSNEKSHLPVLAAAMDMSEEEMHATLGDVHLSNYPENTLFFSPEPGRIGNFNELYYSAVYAYGREIIKDVVPPEKVVNRAHLEAIGQAQPELAKQPVRLAPVKSEEKVEGLEDNPLLTKQIRFQFQPNSTELVLDEANNQQAMKDLNNLLKLAPGSYLVLRGHLDDSKVAEFKARGQAFYNRQAVRAVEQSKLRAESVEKALVDQFAIDAERLDPEGRGWDEPLPGASADDNRRVEVQWFTLE